MWFLEWRVYFFFLLPSVFKSLGSNKQDFELYCGSDFNAIFLGVLISYGTGQAFVTSVFGGLGGKLRLTFLMYRGDSYGTPFR